MGQEDPDGLLDGLSPLFPASRVSMYKYSIFGEEGNCLPPGLRGKSSAGRGVS